MANRVYHEPARPTWNVEGAGATGTGYAPESLGRALASEPRFVWRALNPRGAARTNFALGVVEGTVSEGETDYNQWPNRTTCEVVRGRVS